MATEMVFNRVVLESTPIESFNERIGKFKDVKDFGINEIEEYISGSGKQYIRCQPGKAIVRPGQFARVQSENPNAKFGTLEPVMDGKVQATETVDGIVKPIFKFVLLPDSENKWRFRLDKDGKLWLNS